MQEKAKEPEIRFAGFTGAWEQRVLGDFLEVSMETNSSAKFDKNDVLSISGDYGVVNQIAFQGRSFASNSVVKYGVLHNEDIVYTKSPLKANPYGIIKTNKGKAGIVSPLYAIYHPKNNLVPSFVQSYFEQNERLNNYLRPLVNKGAKNNMLISNEKAISGKVIFPSRKEQEKISALLERVDSLLTLHQRKYEKLLNIKKSMLEKMFPKEGEVVPEIRFKGFTGAWEQRKFGEMANRRSEVSASGNLPRVEYEDIVSGTGTLNKDVFEKQSQKQGIVFHSGDVLYGKLRPYLQNWLLASFNGLAVGDFWVLEPQGLNSNYLYRIIQTKQFDEIANQSVGTKMPRADWKLVSKATFLNPASFNEQRLIGKFFKDIDSLLTLHQRQSAGSNLPG